MNTNAALCISNENDSSNKDILRTKNSYVITRPTKLIEIILACKKIKRFQFYFTLFFQRIDMEIYIKN